MQRRQSALRLSRCSGFALHSPKLAHALTPSASAGCLRRFLLRRRLRSRSMACLRRPRPSVTSGTSAPMRSEASCFGRLRPLSTHWQIRFRMPRPFQVAPTRCPWGRLSCHSHEDPPDGAALSFLQVQPVLRTTWHGHTCLIFPITFLFTPSIIYHIR